MSTKKEPRFINLQTGTVSIFDENGRRVEVASWHRRRSDDDPQCIITGEYYRNFVSARGPLYPFPGEEPKKPVYAKQNPTTIQPASVEDTPVVDPKPNAATPEELAQAAEGNAKKELREIGFESDYLKRHTGQLVEILASALAFQELNLEPAEVNVNIEKNEPTIPLEIILVEMVEMVQSRLSSDFKLKRILLEYGKRKVIYD